MKGKKIIALVVAVVMALSLCLALTACGAPKLVGTYSYWRIHNHKNTADPVTYTYKLELYEDGSYIMNYETFWAIPVVDLTYSRDVTSYGEYTDATAEDAEEGTHVYELAFPTRITMVAHERGGMTAAIDTDNWPVANPEEEYEGNVKFTLNQRAAGEDWATAADFLNSYGRAYKVSTKDADALSGGAGGSMKIEEIKDVNGAVAEQIPSDNAVELVTVAA